MPSADRRSSGATILTGPPGASVDVTSIRVPAARAARTCAAVVIGCVARSMLPGVASTSRLERPGPGVAAIARRDRQDVVVTQHVWLAVAVIFGRGVVEYDVQRLRWAG